MIKGKISKIAVAGLIGASLVSVALAASPSSKKERILAYLRSLPGRSDKKVISGQHSSGGYGLFEIEQLFQLTGEYVGLIEGGYWEAGHTSIPGFMNYRQPNDTLLDYWRNGGLVGNHFGMGAPGLSRTLNSHRTRNVDFSILMDKQSGLFADFHDMLRIMGDGLEELRDEGVVVFFRPYHEMNGDWFWWGARSREEFLFLWRETYDYMVNVRDLDNLIWVFSPNGRREGSSLADPILYYPGSEMVDVVGLDYYSDFPEQMRQDDYENFLETGKIFAFTELGCHGGEMNFPLYYFDNAKYVQAIKNKFSKTAYFLVWSSNWAINNQLNPQGLLLDPWVVNRDDLPRF